MPRISGFSDFARSVANRLVVREGSVTTRVGVGDLRTFLSITPDDERGIRATIVQAIGEGYDFCERTFDLAKNDAMDCATLVTFQVVAEEMGISRDGTAKQIQDRIFAEFHRLKKALEDERKAGAKERKRIEEMILRHKKGYEEQASECEEKARRLKAELEDVEHMAEEHRRDVDAHQAVWSLVVIDDAVADGFSFDSKGED